MRKLVVVLCLCMLGLASTDLQAQIKKRKKPKSASKISNFKGNDNVFAGKRYWSFGGNMNAMNYFGDIAPKASLMSTDISFTRPGFGVTATYRFGPRYSLKTSFNYGRISGDDNQTTQLNDPSQWRYVRNLSFRNDIKELSVVGVLDAFKHPGGFTTRKNIVPYLFAGVAVFHHNPKAIAPGTFIPGLNRGAIPLESAGQWVELQPLQTGGVEYSKFAIAFPVGIGVRYKVNRNLDASFEMSARYLLTDFLDDMGTLYTDSGLEVAQMSDTELEALSQNQLLAYAMADRSLEPVATMSGEARDVAAFDAFLTYNPETDRYYGFGQSGPGNYRGTAESNDVYTITSINVSYIMGSGPFMLKLFRKKNAKFR